MNTIDPIQLLELGAVIAEPMDNVVQMVADGWEKTGTPKNVRNSSGDIVTYFDGLSALIKNSIKLKGNDTWYLRVSFNADTVAGSSYLICSTVASLDRFILVIIDGVLIAQTVYGSGLGSSKSGAVVANQKYDVLIKNDAGVISLIIDDVEQTGVDAGVTTATLGFTLGARNGGNLKYTGWIQSLFNFPWSPSDQEGSDWFTGETFNILDKAVLYSKQDAINPKDSSVSGGDNSGTGVNIVQSDIVDSGTPSGYGIQYDGLTKETTFGNDSSLDLTEGVSIVCCNKVISEPTDGNGRLVSKGTAYDLYYVSGVYTFAVAGLSVALSGYAIGANRIAVGTYDMKAAKIYVEDDIDSTDTTAPITVNTDPVKVATYPTLNRRFNGLIPLVMIFPFGLTRIQVEYIKSLIEKGMIK